MSARAARADTRPTTAADRGWASLLAPLYRAQGRELGGVLRTLRLVYVSLFLFQTLLALLLGVSLGVLLPSVARPNDVLAGVLFGVAGLQLPIGVMLTLRLTRLPSVGGALAAVTVAAVVLSSSGWFTALMVLSGQRLIWLLAMVTLVMLSYAIGLFLIPRAARAALVAPPTPPSAEPATHPHPDTPAAA